MTSTKNKRVSRNSLRTIGWMGQNFFFFFLIFNITMFMVLKQERKKPSVKAKKLKQWSQSFSRLG